MASCGTESAPLFDQLVAELGDPLCPVQDERHLVVHGDEELPRVVSLDAYRARRVQHRV